MRSHLLRSPLGSWDYLSRYAVAGGLLLAGSGILMGIAPGILYPSSALWLAVPAAIAGAVLLGHGVAAHRQHRRRIFEPRDLRTGTYVVAACLSVFVVLLLTAVGTVPGLYLPVRGSITTSTLCPSGPHCPVSYQFSAKTQRAVEGFPPGAMVHLSWEVAGGANSTIGLWQTPPNSNAPSWSFNGSGAYGNVTFVGTGGLFIWGGESPMTCLNACPATITWTYVPAW
jgi:hypothetical protein